MSSLLSTRVGMRWIPGEKNEPTDTMVMNLGGWFIDLRIVKDNGSIDWAMAGQRQTLSEAPLTFKWTHWIDSRGSTEPDIGCFQPGSLATDSIETGSMVNPETGLLTPYEETWRSLVPVGRENFPKAWILRSEDGKTFLGKIGGNFIGLQGGEGPGSSLGFCATRESWDKTRNSWATLYQTGEWSSLESLPCMSSYFHGVKGRLEWEGTCKDGDTAEAFGKTYIVCAIEGLGKDTTNV
ncbi:hypothetical protein HRR77_001808 [Exophiala dermatitidis]|nr:hypothetical protein HRR77_001808 [Exophiala dermatitidis]